MLLDFLEKGKALQLTREVHTRAFWPPKSTLVQGSLQLMWLYPSSARGCGGSKYKKKKKNVIFPLMCGKFCTNFLFFLGICIFSVRLHFQRHWDWLCDDLFVGKREVIVFPSLVCRASHREIFLETSLFLFIFFPVTVYLPTLGVSCLYPFSVQN